MKSEEWWRFMLDLFLIMLTVVAFCFVILGWNWVLHG